jgi:hypothetical protein
MNRALLSVLVVISRLRSPALSESKLPSLFWQIYVNLWLDFGAISSVVERLLHTQEVAGSNPASRIYATGRQKTVTSAVSPCAEVWSETLSLGAVCVVLSDMKRRGSLIISPIAIV